jgi:hypothetical protein
MALWGFLLSSSLLKACQQMVGPSDRHPYENTSGKKRLLHNVTHQHMYESETSIKIKLFI